MAANFYTTQIWPCFLQRFISEMITCIKDSSGDLENMLSMCKNFDSFDVYAGSETYFLPVLQAGGAGTITATANITASKCVEVFKAFQNDLKDVQNLQDELSNDRDLLQKACASVGFSSGLKIILSSLIKSLRGFSFESWSLLNPRETPLSQGQTNCHRSRAE